MRPLVSLLAVISTDGFISRGRGVPWDLPIDKAHFRAYAAGKWCLLGRTTYEEMLGWFRDHHPLVMSRDPSYQPPVGEKVSSVPQAIALTEAAGEPELVVIGGAAAFSAAMPFANRLVITHVNEALWEGVPFPRFTQDEWEPVTRESHAADAHHPFSFEIVVYQRVHKLDKAA